MSYESKSENQPLQNLANGFNIPPIAVAFGILAGLSAFGLLKPIVGLCLFLGVWAFVRHLDSQERLREAKARAAAYANMIGPIVVGSDNPEQDVYAVAEKAKEWKEKLKLSGNPYADKLPVVEFPFSPMLYQTGQLSAGWSIYQKQLAEMQHLENIKWHEGKCPAELKALFASAVLPSPKQPEQ